MRINESKSLNSHASLVRILLITIIISLTLSNVNSLNGVVHANAQAQQQPCLATPFTGIPSYAPLSTTSTYSSHLPNSNSVILKQINMENITPFNAASSQAASNDANTQLSYDEQFGLTFTQDFSSLAYNVTAVQQTYENNWGPAYLLNGLSNQGYWYQVGIAWNWPYISSGYNSGFNFFYEVYSPTGVSIFPTNVGGGLQKFSSQVNQGDSILLSLTFSSGNVVMYAYDWNTHATASETYSSQGATYFVGSPTSDSNSQGFFTGLMTEQYHPNTYYGNMHEVTYTENSFAASSAWMWIDEYNTANRTQILFFDSTPSPVSYTNPLPLNFLSSHNATEYSNAYEFITGATGIRLNIRTFDWSGDLLPSCIVNLTGFASIISDSNGWANFTGVPKGNYTISIVWQGIQVSQTPVSITNSNVTMDINCLVYNLKIKVTDLFGLPFSGANVVITLPNGTTASTTTGSDGLAVFLEIPTGSFTGTVSYLGLTNSISGNVAQSSTTPTSVELPFSPVVISTIIIIIVIAVVAASIFLRLRRKAPTIPTMPPPPTSPQYPPQPPSPQPQPSMPVPITGATPKAAQFCSNCGAPLQQGVKFCTNCGAPIIHPTPTTYQQAEPTTQPTQPTLQPSYPPPPPPPQAAVPLCPTCGNPLTYLQQYNRWYCTNCRKYL